MRPLCLSVVVLLSTVVMAGAQVFPEIPNSSRVLSLLEVKNFWVNKMPAPSEPSLLRMNRGAQTVEYHRQVGERHRLIQAIRSGQYDAEARLAMLRHNIAAYQMMGDDAKVAELMEQLAKEEALLDERRSEEENADRLERLIAATDRLAAAIEANGGEVPDGAEEIVPFERDADDTRDVVIYLQEEIARCRQPIVIHQPRHSNYYDHGRGHSHRRGSSSGGGVVSIPVTPRGADERPRRTSGVTSYRQPQVRQPQVRQPQVRPIGAKPQVKPQPQRRTVVPSQPQVRQPQTRTVRTPAQPRVKPARSVTPSQPRVRQAR